MLCHFFFFTSQLIWVGCTSLIVISKSSFHESLECTALNSTYEAARFGIIINTLQKDKRLLGRENYCTWLKVKKNLFMISKLPKSINNYTGHNRNHQQSYNNPISHIEEKSSNVCLKSEEKRQRTQRKCSLFSYFI